MPRFLALVAAALLLAPTVLAEGDEEDREDRRSPTGEDRSGRSDDDDDGPSRAIGSFQTPSSNPRSVHGDFVDFTWSSTGVGNVTAAGLPLFGAETTGAVGGDAPEIRADGSRVEIHTAGYELKAHDNPNAIFDFEVEGTLRLLFPLGTTLSVQREDRVIVNYADGRQARVFGEGITVSGLILTATDDATFMLDARKGAFDVHRSEISNAVAKRHVGAEVTLGRPDNATGEIPEDVVEFGNVTVRTIAKQGNVTLVLDGHGFDGRVIVVNVDPQVFGQRNREDFQFWFDNASIGEASSLVDALDPDNDGLAPEYYFVQSDDGFQVILTVPHYSVHTFTIAGLAIEVTPSIVAGLMAGVLAVAVGVVVLFRAPKRE